MKRSLKKIASFGGGYRRISRKKYAKPKVGRKNCELIGSKPTIQSRNAIGVGVDTRWGKVSIREIVVIVPLLLEPERFGGLLSRIWGPTCAVCNVYAPNWLVSLYHPYRVSRRCGGAFTGFVPRIVTIY